MYSTNKTTELLVTFYLRLNASLYLFLINHFIDLFPNREWSLLQIRLINFSHEKWLFKTNDYDNMPCLLQTIVNKHYWKVSRSFHSFTHKRDTFQDGIVVSLLQPFKAWPSINNGSVSEPQTLHVFCNDVSVGSLAALGATKMRGISSNRWKNTRRRGVEIFCRSKSFFLFLVWVILNGWITIQNFFAFVITTIPYALVDINI